MFFPKSLSEIVINYIVRHFETYASIYNSGCNDIPRIHYEFLQRRYSEVLLERLSFERNINNYLPLLLNKWVQELDVRRLKYANPTVIIERLEVMGQDIKGLSMKGRDFSEDIILKVLLLVPNLTELYLTWTKCTDAALKAISNLRSTLAVLCLSHTDITNSGLRYLCEKDANDLWIHNTVLKRLYIETSTVTDDGLLFILDNCPNLHIFYHEKLANAIHRNFTACSTFRCKLTKLIVANDQGLDDNYVSEVLQICTIICPCVSSLIVYDISDSSALHFCCGFKKVSEIKCFITDSFAESINYAPLLQRKGSDLVHLDLHHGTLSLETLCQTCPNLQTLCLQDIIIAQKNHVAIQGFLPKLDKLNFNCLLINSDVYESFLLIINNSPILKCLSFISCYLSNKFLNCLLECNCMQTLEKLQITFSEISFDFAKDILSLTKSLKLFVLEDCGIDYSDHNSLLRSGFKKNIVVQDYAMCSDTQFNYNFDF